jgi:hypothetical protein
MQPTTPWMHFLRPRMHGPRCSGRACACTSPRLSQSAVRAAVCDLPSEPDPSSDPSLAHWKLERERERERESWIVAVVLSVGSVASCGSCIDCGSSVRPGRGMVESSRSLKATVLISRWSRAMMLRSRGMETMSLHCRASLSSFI